MWRWKCIYHDDLLSDKQDHYHNGDNYNDENRQDNDGDGPARQTSRRSGWLDGGGWRGYVMVYSCLDTHVDQYLIEIF